MLRHPLAVRATVVTGLVAGLVSPPLQAHATTVGACQASALRYSISSPEGAAGTLFYRLRFHNVSGSACSLTGHPHVAFVAGSPRHQVGASARWTAPSHVTVLQSGASATALLGIANVVNFSPALCKPVAVTALRVMAPGTQLRVYLHWPSTACSNPAARQLSVRSVVPQGAAA